MKFLPKHVLTASFYWLLIDNWKSEILLKHGGKFSSLKENPFLTSFSDTLFIGCSIPTEGIYLSCPLTWQTYFFIITKKFSN